MGDGSTLCQFTKPSIAQRIERMIKAKTVTADELTEILDVFYPNMTHNDFVLCTTAASYKVLSADRRQCGAVIDRPDEYA